MDSVNQKLEKKDSIKRKLKEEKENFNLQSKKCRTTITLLCIVEGNEYNAFAININKNKTISELKSLIQKEKHNDFAGIDPDQLKLWQVEIPDDCYDELVSPQLHGNNKLLGTKKISKYFTKAPVDEHIHIIVSLPETTKTRQELINKVAELQTLLKRSIYEFNTIVVNPKRTKASKWIANIEQVTLKDLKESIFALYQSPELEKDVATLSFSCNDEKYSPKSDLETIPIGNEASKSQYVCSYLVAIANLYEDKFKVYPEKNVSGLNGHGPVDFALIQIQNSRIIGITEVKDKDFQQGVAQNAVQCESALSNKKKNIFGIITDSEKWFFLECSSDNDRKPKFKLSKPMVIIYGDEDMEDRVKKVLGHIAWLLEETQRLDELKDEN
ncbi:hypothetical protein C1646_667554 [Rhizophagus diaphanus]|nr:hypothetical protein C1646_667554 [Rhizophagus diaphanus] [Rhizophagus sp. MUCL 43196]